MQNLFKFTCNALTQCASERFQCMCISIYIYVFAARARLKSYIIFKYEIQCKYHLSRD